jgi:hypothetical protein
LAGGSPTLEVVVAQKTASLVFFYFGEDSYVNKLAQETVPLWKALDGYDHTVLLRHEVDFGPFELSEKAEKLANVLDIPTAANLARELNRLRVEGYAVDLYVFSHGWRDCFRVSNGTYGDNGTVTQRYLTNEVQPLKLRAVWQCNCYGSTMNDCWTALGAKVTAGSRFVNYYPTKFNGFIDRWRDGVAFGTAVTKSDTKLVHTPVQAYITVDAAGRLKQWDGNLLQAAQVLGNNDSSRRYFRECWLGEDTPDGMSGRQIMNHASEMLFAGDRAITKESVLTW